MKKWLRPVVATVTSLLAVVARPADLHPFTVRDSIELSTFLLPASQWGMASPVLISPDTTHLVVATIRGNLDSGKREATLWLFETKAVRAFVTGGARPEPIALARVASASNREPISHWRWATDSASVLFLGADDEGIERLYRVGLEDHAVATLSRPDQEVSEYDEARGVVAYLAHAPVHADSLYQAGGSSLPDMEVATGKNVIPLLFPAWMSTIFHESTDQLWTYSDGSAKLVPQSPARLTGSSLTVSPDGRSAVVTPQVEHVPPSWERYRALIQYPGFDILADTPETEGGSDYYRPKRYAIVDLASGTMTPLLDAPIQILQKQSSAVIRWSSDSSKVALLGVYPTLTPAQQSGGGRTVLPCAIMISDVQTRRADCAQWEPIADYEHVGYNARQQIIDLHWTQGDRALEARYGTPNEGRATSRVVFSLSGPTWKPGKVLRIAKSDDLNVIVHQSLDEPPLLQASVGRSQPRTLLDPNPQLKNVALGTAEMYHWRDADGDEWSGALVKPSGFAADRRYPLVIQTHNLDSSKFLVDGPSATGFAARALAARGILVLQVDEIKKNDGNPRESDSGAAGYQAAINQLVAEGHVDPRKVGITTWSHMGPYAMAGLIETPHTYAAATFAEAAYNGYGEYLMNIDYMGTAREKMFRAQYGPKPFGRGLEAWMSRNAAFRTDRVCAPVLFQINSPPALVYSWDSYAALRAQDKPVDLFYIRGGDHVLVKPTQRLAEQGMNVDWFDYWLNGHRDPDTRKDEQYKRWDALKTHVECPAK